MPDSIPERLKRVACYVPLAFIGAELIWIFVLFIGLIFAVGDTPYVNTPEKSRFFDLLSMWPASLGLFIGVVATLFRWPVKILQWGFLIFGTIGCAGLVWLCIEGFW